MKIFNYTTPCDTTNSIPEYYMNHHPHARLLFFDIETTGFIAKNTTLYLIGALWYENDTLYIRQWFNDDGRSEKEVLHAFDEFSASFTHLVHFNGNGFDLPYLKQKATLLDISFDTDVNLEQIDIYKSIRKYKNIFVLENLKQTSIEAFLGIQREDQYTGKELIQIYQKYVARPNPDAESLLLLHNHDDLLGMPQISQILNYTTFFENIDINSISISETECTLDIHFTFLSESLPQRISISKDDYYLNAIHTEGHLQLPLFRGTLKHFFKDYKNYYYLPTEDMAIHKSVATYVDAQNKQKATRETCYINKEDVYVPCIQPVSSEQFKFSYKDKKTYQTLDSFINCSLDIQKDYIKKILQTFL